MMYYSTILDNLGNTPLVKMELNNHKQAMNLYAKLEFYNPTGSVKDRAASYVLEKLLNNKEINYDTTIIESTSGNFGIALSSYCKKYGLKFCCVIDAAITDTNENIIRSLGAEVIKITEADSSGGYLLNRIKKVNEILVERPNSYWINQYANPYNAEAYYTGLGNELCEQLNNIDYIFIGVSSGGTITGISRKIKERFPHAKVIAVDIVGSVIFGGKPQKRHIPGMGSSMRPEILAHSQIDDIIIIDEVSCIFGCHELLEKHSIFAGGSSGAVYSAINQYFDSRNTSEVVDVVALFPDRGDRYTSTIYNEQWLRNFVVKEKTSSI
ncbi:2,3-diaminopropionate biosynthesis protein SbnA [Paenibacillus assamensis]|uniref:2,3-diaminopropionate biosynthesis protein SbnA n=1 Tax=Paenibacillus assamensis TaxID=311244 RepID=UPI0004242A94|nr:2,3-diaminopropionate biosynthesis protein SbnA [Paenibacillus assamensis]